jgi:hypothetical protein
MKPLTGEWRLHNIYFDKTWVAGNAERLQLLTALVLVFNVITGKERSRYEELS